MSLNSEPKRRGVEFDDALNSAGWVMIQEMRKLGRPADALVFNYMKPMLKEAIEAYLNYSYPLTGSDDAVLPCSVGLPPATVIQAGCKLSTLIEALRARGMSVTGSKPADSETSAYPDADGLKSLLDFLRETGALFASRARYSADFPAQLSDTTRLQLIAVVERALTGSEGSEPLATDDAQLVERLKERRAFFLNGAHWLRLDTADTDCFHAGARIEQLWRDVVSWQTICDQMRAENERLQVELPNVRDALRDVLSYVDERKQRIPITILDKCRRALKAMTDC